MSLAAARAQYPHLNDYTDQELLDIVAQSNNIQAGTPMYKRMQSELLQYDRTTGEKAKDTVIQLGQGVTRLAQGVATIGGALIPGVNAFDNPVVNNLAGGANDLDKFKSRGLRNQRAAAEVNRDITTRKYRAPGDTAVDDFMSSAGAQIENYTNTPGLLAEDVITNLPQLLAGGLAGRAAGATAKMAGAGEKGVRAAAIGGAYGANAGLQGADIGKDTYDRLIALGVDENEANRLATIAAVKAGGVSLLTNAAVPGGGMSERMLAGAAAQTVGKGGIGRGLARAGADMASEAVEEGYGQYAGNQAVKVVNPNQNLMDNVGSASVQGAAASGPISIYGGLRRGITPPRTETGEIDLTGQRVGPNPLDEPAYQRQGMDPLNAPYQPLESEMIPYEQVSPAAAAPRELELGDYQAPVYGNEIEFTPPAPAPVDAELAEINPVGPPAPAAPPNRGALMAALAQANKALNNTAVKKNGEVANTRAAAPLREILESADPLAAMRALYQNGSHPRDEMLDEWHKALTGQTVSDATAAAAPEVNEAGFVPEPAAQVQAQVDAVRDGRKDVAVLGAQEAAGANTEGLFTGVATGPDGASATVVAATQAKVDAAIEAAKTKGLKEAMGAALGVADPTLTTENAPDAQVVQQVDNATGEVIMEEVATEADLPNIKQVEDTTARVVPVEQALAERQQESTDGQLDEAGSAPGNGSGRGTGAAGTDGKNRQRTAPADAGPDRVGGGTASAPAADSGLDVPAASPAADTDGPVVRRKKTKKLAKYGRHSVDALIDISENTKDEAEFTEARYELYRRWADGVETEQGQDQVEEYLLSDMKEAKGRTGPGAKAIAYAESKEGKAFKARYDAEVAARGVKAGQKLGKKFGVDDGSTGTIAEATSVSNPDNGTDPLTDEDVAGITDGKSAAQWLMDNATNPWHREIAKRIASFVAKGVNVHFLQAGDQVNARVANALNGTAMAVAYQNQDGTYELFFNMTREINQAALLHELIHAATMKALHGATNNVALRSEMRNLLRQIKWTIQDIGANSRNSQETRDTAKFLDGVLIDENELLAYAFSSPTMRDWMKNLGADGKMIPAGAAARVRERAENRAPGVPPVTAWQKFTDAIRKLFGIAPVHQAAFEKMLADRQDSIAGFIEANSDKTLYNQLDEYLDAAMAAQAEMTAAAEPAIAASSSRVITAMGEATRVVSAAARAQVEGKEINGTLLRLMTLRQIDEQFGKRLPAMRDWIGAIFTRGANGSKLAAEADRVAQKWEKSVKNPEERKALAAILLRASMQELELDNTSVKYLNSLDAQQRTEHTALRARLAALSPEAQATRREALDILRRQWEYTRASLESFINHTVADPGLRSARIDQLKQELGRNRGDYFPLSRFGDRVVIGRAAAADGRDVITFHESAAQAEEQVAAHRAAGVKSIVSTLQSKNEGQLRSSTGLMGDLHSMIDSSEAESGVKNSLHESLQQLYLKSLPELSGAKQMIRRENIEGFSTDALRVFADAVTRGSRYAAQLEAAPFIHAAKEAAAAQSKSSETRSGAVVIGRQDGKLDVVRIVPVGTDRLNAVNSLNADGYATEFFNTVPDSLTEHMAAKVPNATPAQVAAWKKELEQQVGLIEEGVEDLRAAKALYNHMIGLQSTEGNQDASPIVDALGQVGYVWYLGFTPAFWLMNMLQNPMIGLPHLGSKYGMGKSSKEWLAASSWFAGVRMGKVFADGKTPFSVSWLAAEAKAGRLKGVNKQELEMLQTLEDKQVLDFTQSMDLTRIGQASNSAQYKAMRWAAAGAHHTEVFNRVSFALAAYRLAMKSSTAMTHAEAVKRAENDTAAVHFDYSYSNKPEVMRGKTTRLLFMFQQYRQHMIYWWAKNVKDMVKNEAPGDRTRALKAALLMGTTQATFAGALGLPFVGTIALLCNLLGGDDEDGLPFDFNKWVTDAAIEQLGETGGEVMAKGIFAGMGMNIGQRIGQGGLLAHAGSEKYERNGDDKVRAYLFDLLGGPLGSIATSMGKSVDAFGSGDVAGGLAHATPKVVSDVIKAYQLESEGLKDKRGQTLAAAEAFDGADVFMQAAGVAPTAVANLKADRGRVADIENKFKEKTRALSANFVESWQRGDQEGLAEAVEEIKAFNTMVGAGKYKGLGIEITGKKLENAIKDRQSRAMMLALTGGTAQTKQQMMIANQTSGLFAPVTKESMRENAQEMPSLGR